MGKNLVFFAFIILNSLLGSAQKKVTTTEQLWLNYINTTKFSKHWGVMGDVQIRTKDDFVKGYALTAARGGVNYFINDNTFLTAGYAYFNYLPGNNFKGISQPEHRPWQQIQWVNKYPHTRVTQRLRLEERFRHKVINAQQLDKGYNFNYRVRYQLGTTTPIGKKPLSPHTFAFVLNDEIMINAGKKIVNNMFDQNRLMAGFNFYVNKRDYVQAVYMNIFQKQSVAEAYNNIHMVRIAYNHNLDLTKK